MAQPSATTDTMPPTPFNTALDNSRFVTFTAFPKLPVELQLKVWNSAVPAPGFVMVRAQQHYTKDNRSHRVEFILNTRPSGLLDACRASREVILKHYNVCIAFKDMDRKIRLDGLNDTVFFLPHKPSPRGFIHRYENPVKYPGLLPNQFSGISNLVLDYNHDYQKQWPHLHAMTQELTIQFPDLKHLTLAVDVPSSGWKLRADDEVKLVGIKDALSRYKDAYYLFWRAMVRAKLHVFKTLLREKGVALHGVNWKEPEIVVKPMIIAKGTST